MPRSSTHVRYWTESQGQPRKVFISTYAQALDFVSAWQRAGFRAEVMPPGLG